MTADMIDTVKSSGTEIKPDGLRPVRGESGIAIILAMIMLLVMSVLALTVSFNSNNDFHSMSVFKRGQQSFLAAERCVEQARVRFEVIGIETLYFLLQSSPTGSETANELTIAENLDNDSFCRTGARDWHDPDSDNPAPLISIPPPTKTSGRPIKNVSLPSGGIGAAAVVPASFQVTGKDSQDEDMDDSNENINTGTEIAVGLESFIPGGASNIYSGQ